MMMIVDGHGSIRRRYDYCERKPQHEKLALLDELLSDKTSMKRQRDEKQRPWEEVSS